MSDIKKEEQIKQLNDLKKTMTKEENKRKVLYAENELHLIREDRRMECIRILMALIRRYDITDEDLGVILEIAPHL